MTRRTIAALGMTSLLTLGSPSPAGDVSSAGLVVLNLTADDALSMTGNSSIRVPAAAVYVNSNSERAVRTVGTATLDTPEMYIVGVPSFGGSSGCTGTVKRSSAPYVDPYNPFAIPSYAGMVDRGGVSIRSNSSMTLQPGRYSGGILVTGQANLTFSPGVYLVENGLDIRSGSVNGSGVTIIVMSGIFKISGTSQLRLTPPATGMTAGITLAMSPENESEMTLVGGSEVDIHGSIYARKSLLTLTGNSSVSTQGPTMGDLVVADRVRLTGTGAIKIGHQAMPAVKLPNVPTFD